MRLLAITNDFPLPRDRGGPERFFGLLRALGEQHDVHVLALERANTTPELVAELASATGGPVEVFERPARRDGWVKAMREGVPPWIAEQRTAALLQRALELVDDTDAVVILDDYAAIYAPPLAAHRPVICDKSNVNGWSAAASPPSGGLRGRLHRRLAIHLSRRFERNYLEPVTAVVVTSEEEREHMLSLYGREVDAVVPSAVDVPEPAVTLSGERVLGWLGTHEYEVNVEGLARFVEEAWEPLGRDGFRLLVVGGGAPPEVEALERYPGVEILGYVEDLDEVFSQLSGAVVPLWRGPGVKLKTVTFMAAGVPVVGTPVAVEGIDGRDGEHFLVAQEPAALAQAARRLVADRDLARRIGHAGRELVSADYSWPSVGAQFRRTVERAVASAA